jgi:uncharacterized membrane protein
MTDAGREPDREDVLYTRLFSYLKQNGVVIALAAPVVLVWILPIGPAGVLVVPLIYLGEAIVYAAAQRKRRGVRPGPGAGLQALWRLLASLLILGGGFGFVATGEPVAAFAVALGVGILMLIWSRTTRVTGDDTTAFAGRMMRLVGAAILTAIVVIVSRLILLVVERLGS